MPIETIAEDAPIRAQNTHNSELKRSEDNSADCAHTFERIAQLFCDLRASGIDARPTSEGLELNGPTAALTVELLDRIRADRDGLLAWLWRQAIAEGVSMASEASGGDAIQGAADAGDGEPAGSDCCCPWCGPVDLRDDPEGLRCGRCERLAWVSEGDSLIRADWVDDDLEGVVPDDVPTCPICGRWCDTETLAGAWRCSRCDPQAEARRRRTLRIMERVERLRPD